MDMTMKIELQFSQDQFCSITLAICAVETIQKLEKAAEAEVKILR